MHGTSIYVTLLLLRCFEYAVEPNFKLYWNPIYPHETNGINGTNGINESVRFFALVLKVPRHQRLSQESLNSVPSLADNNN